MRTHHIYAIICLLFSSPVLANTTDVSNLSGQYPSSRSFENFNCAICHSNIAQNTALGAFGSAYKGAGRSTAALFSIQNADTDGDGFTNVAEFTAGSNPGDRQSTVNNVPAPAPPGGSSGNGPGKTSLSGLDSAQSASQNQLADTNCGMSGRTHGMGLEHIMMILLLMLVPVATLFTLRTSHV